MRPVEFDMSNFCAWHDEPREFTRRPFSLAGHLVATSGCVIAFKKLRENVPGIDVPDRVAEHIVQLINMLDEREFCEPPLCIATAFNRCDDCGGTGSAKASMCPDCNGEGWECCCGVFYTCSNCKGKPYVTTTGEGHCLRCYGTGVCAPRLSAIEILPDVVIDFNYYRLFKDLPSLSIAKGDGDMVLLKSAIVGGAIMGLKKP